MSTTNPNRTPDGGNNGTPHGLGALLRGAADGELSAVQQGELDRHLAAHPQDSARIEFEKGLRKACARVMQSPDEGRAPVALRQIIEASLAARAHKEPQPVVARTHEGGRVEVRAHRWRRVRNLVAVAAAIPLLVAAWLINNRNGPNVQDGADASILPIDFLTREHSHCEGVGPDKLMQIKIADVPKKMREMVGKALGVEPVQQAGFQFVGMTSCRTPGGGNAAHLVFKRHARGEVEGGAEPAGEVRLSVFVQNDKGKRRMTEGLAWNGQGPDTGQAGGPLNISAWLSRDGLDCYVVTDCAASRDLARRALDGPEGEAMLCGSGG